MELPVLHGFAATDEVCNRIMHWKCHARHTVHLHMVLKLEHLAAVNSILVTQHQAICDGNTATAYKVVGIIVGVDRKVAVLKPSRRLHGCNTHNDTHTHHPAKSMQAGDGYATAHRG